MREDLTRDTALSEHGKLREELQRAAHSGGETGQAARRVMEVLLPHALREEAFAIPPLRLLPRLARGEVTADMASILPLTDRLRAELPRMLEEHKRIVDALVKLLQAATREQNPGYAELARKVIHHAQQEEEVLYPAAILVGDHLRLRLGLK